MNGEGRTSIFRGIREDKFGFLVLILTIASFGIISIYGASQDTSHAIGWAPLYMKQIIWVVIGSVRVSDHLFL